MKAFICLLDDGFFYAHHRCAHISNFIKYDDEISIDKFFTILEPGTSIEIVIDVSEEELEIIAVPKVYPWERKNLLKINEAKINKEKVYFYSSSIVNDKKNTYIRFLKIYHNKHIERFIDSCVQKRYFINGIYISDLLVETYLKSRKFRKKSFLTPRFTSTLLTIRRSVNSYKQLFINNGSVELVRTIDIKYNLNSVLEVYEQIVRECELTVRYLYNSNLIEKDSIVNFLFVDNDDAKSRESEILQFSESFFINSFEWVNKNDSVRLVSFNDLIDVDGKHDIVINDLATFSLCIVDSLPFISSHINTEAVKFVRLVSGLRVGGIIASILLLLVGGGYLLYLYLHYLQTNEVLHSLSSQNNMLTSLKEDLESKTRMPYDPAELIALIELANKFQQVKNQSDVRHLIIDFAYVLSAFPDIKLVKLEIKREPDSRQLVSPVFNVKAQFVLTNVDVLYQKNIDRMKRFYKYLGSRERVLGLKFINLPLELDPDKPQTVSDRMLMPISLPFELQFRWGRRND